jgi:hypothetical protein
MSLDSRIEKELRAVGDAVNVDPHSVLPVVVRRGLRRVVAGRAANVAIVAAVAIGSVFGVRVLQGVRSGPVLSVTGTGPKGNESPAASSYTRDEGTMILRATSGGVSFWLFRNHNDRAGNVCYGFASGVTPPTEKIDSGGYCLDKDFVTIEADPITARSPEGILQMAVGGAISANVSRVEVIVAGIPRDAVIRHGFYFAAMAYGAFDVKAFDSHGMLLAEANRPAPPTGPPPAPVLTPPLPAPSS